MGEIQVFTEEFAEGASILYFRSGRGRNRPAGKSLPQYFNELHFSNPWASSELPSYVYLEKGKVVGMIGVVPRPMVFCGKPITLASKSMYLVDPDHRGIAAVQLLGRMLKGPQDLSWTDGASGSVSAIWRALGGHTASLYAFNWIRILRPFGTLRSGLDRAGGFGRLLRTVSGLVAVPGDVLVSKVPIQALRIPVSPYQVSEASIEELLACIQEIGWRESLKPSYSLPSFSWLMNQSALVKRFGNLRKLIVTDPSGARVGWLIYYANPGGTSLVMQIGVRRREDFENTLLALFRDAWDQDSVCIKGASIPQHLTTLTDQYCFFRHPQNRVVLHAKNPEVSNAIRLGEAAMTRLDGTCWMRFSHEQWD